MIEDKLNMTEDGHYYRRRIPRPQLEVLVQYMERYPALALASVRSRDGHIQRKRMWEKIARTLNRVDQNQARSGHGWHRYWLDLKFKIRRKYSLIQKCHASRTPCALQLSALEQRLARVLTDERGDLFPAGAALATVPIPLKGHANDILKPMSDRYNKVDDILNINDVRDDTDVDFITDVADDPLPEHVLLPDSSDVKPNVDTADEDPIQIAQEEKKTLEELRREILEFELRRQKELFEIEKQQKIERHEMEMSLLMIRKQIMTRELNKL